MNAEDVYRLGFWITWVLTFLIVWIACASDGGMIGFCLGWMPAIIIAYIVAFLWPLVWFGVLVVVMKLWH